MAYPVHSAGGITFPTYNCWNCGVIPSLSISRLRTAGWSGWAMWSAWSRRGCRGRSYSGQYLLVARPMVLGAAGRIVQCPTSSPVMYMIAGMQLHGSLAPSGSQCTPPQTLMHLLRTAALGVRLLLLPAALCARGLSRAPRIVPGTSAL